MEGNKVESLIKGAEVEKKLKDGKTEKEYPDALSKDALIKGLQTPEELMENKNLIQLAKTCFQTRGQHDGWASKISFLNIYNFHLSLIFHFSEILHDRNFVLGQHLCAIFLLGLFLGWTFQ